MDGVANISFRIARGADAVDCRQLAALFGRSGWGAEASYDEERLRGSCEAASLVLSALDAEGRLLGFARALSDDFLSVTWIAEVLVDPAHRRQGIGSALMNEAIAAARHTAIYAEALPGGESFFAKFGIVPRSGLVACSRKPDPDAAS